MRKNNIYIIAEAGVNHNGSLDIAKKMILEAKNAGANAIKFQTFNVDNLVSKNAPKANYQKKNTHSKESQYEMLKKLSLTYSDFKTLKQECKKINIDFLSSPFDIESIDILHSIGLTTFKIPSGEITNYPYLKKIASVAKKIIISTGMSTIQEIQDAVNTLYQNGITKEQITLLHCNTEYPTPLKDVNLRAMLTLKNLFNLNVGYSDHTQGIEVAIAAATLGASIIEKHFTLDKNMNGPDHKASITPSDLSLMIKYIRNIEIALGSSEKIPTQSELKNINIVRKSIFIKNKLKKGSIITEKDIEIKRPGNGISPMNLNQIIGKKIKIDIDKETQLKWEHLK